MLSGSNRFSSVCLSLGSKLAARSSLDKNEGEAYLDLGEGIDPTRASRICPAFGPRRKSWLGGRGFPIFFQTICSPHLSAEAVCLLKKRVGSADRRMKGAWIKALRVGLDVRDANVVLHAPILE